MNQPPQNDAEGKPGNGPGTSWSDGIANAIHWLGNRRAVLLFPVFLLVVGWVAMCTHPLAFISPTVLGLEMPSERAIPHAKAAPGVDINEQDVVWRFRFAATGTEFRSGIPYWVFRVLPRIFADEFNGRGWERFGFGKDDTKYYESRPVGRGLALTDSTLNIPFLHVTVSLKRVSVNCSGCHRGEYVDPAGQVTYVDGMPNHTADLQAFKRFSARAFQDDRFNADRLIEEINFALTQEELKDKLTRQEELVYRFMVFLLKDVTKTPTGAWMDSRADNGPGRIDPFNAVKFEIIGAPDDKSAGQIDFPSIWNQGPAIRSWHHFDGNTMSSKARNIGSVLGVGGVAMSVATQSIEGIGRWLDNDLRPPPYPFARDPQDQEDKGRSVFTQHCAMCHGLYDPKSRAVTTVSGSTYMERVMPKTDPERSKAFLKPSADALNDFGERRAIWEKNGFRATETGQYLCGPLDGIWARAPYLHVGSVPTLADLLKPPTSRPKRFFRGSRHYDEKNVGWVSTENMDGDRVLFEYRVFDDNDAPIPGNGNMGHEYGTTLDDGDKAALLAYLKTL